MLTPEKATFVEYYVKHGKAKEAASAAGSPLYLAEQQASAWMCDPEVMGHIQLGIAANPFDVNATRRKTLDHAVALATSDITQAFSIDPATGAMTLKNFNDMPLELRVSIKKFNITEIPVPYCDTPKRQISFELHSKTDAMAQVVKMLGMASPERHIISAAQVDAMPEDHLDTLLQSLTKIGASDGV